MKRLKVLIAAVFVIFSAQMYSQPGDAKALHRIMGKLNLTEVQKKDVENVGFDMAKQLVAQKANLATAKIELRQLFKADNPDKSAIEKKINEMSDIGVQLRMIKINSWFAINKLLTPDQQKIWKKALGDRQAFRRHEMMKHRMTKRMDKRQLQSPRNEKQTTE
jgi:Spy/CpxP family protein refolding chaperone